MDTPNLLCQTLTGPNGILGLITLNRPTALNALTYPMIKAIKTHLSLWDNDPKIIAIAIQACEGRAFCAGGDIKKASQLARTEPQAVQQFFSDEYALNYEIATLKKPYIAFINGLCMGGGLGISVHGRYRLISKHAQFAMPETGIGFFPDVGASYFLQQSPGYLGRYIGLTGLTLTASDALYSQLATHTIEASAWPLLLEALQQLHPNEFDTQWPLLIAQHTSTLPRSQLSTQQAHIDEHFKQETVQAIITSLETCLLKTCQQTFSTLKKRCPTSLCIALKAQQQTADLKKCLAQELIITEHLLAEENFHEGVRAQLIDKDQRPNWQPKTVTDVDPAFIARCFEPK